MQTSDTTPHAVADEVDQRYASSPRIIRLEEGRPCVVNDTWRVVRDVEAATALVEVGASAVERSILPVDVYLSMRDIHANALRHAGAWIAPEADFEAWAEHLLDAPVIAIDFPSFRDGRGLSIAVMLRTRYGYRGELRAIGDVLRDQLEYMRRCGFDAFCVRADKNIDDAIKGFSELTVRYQGMVGDPTPLFRRRDRAA